MTFTKTPPTTPGDYRWKADGRESSRQVEVWLYGETLLGDYDGMTARVSEMGGEWCRLVPADVIEGVRIAALEEALALSVRGLPPMSCRAILTAKINNSKHVMEGRE